MIQLRITKKYNNKMLKAVILNEFPALKQSDLSKALLNGDIKINSKRIRKNMPLMEGDLLTVYIADELLKPKTKLPVVWEDANLLVINKPAGIAVEEGDPCICSLAYEHMLQNKEINPDIGSLPHAVHRLDVNTRGLLLIAKNDITADILTDAIKKRKVQKVYEAVVVGMPDPEKAQLHNYLTKDSAGAKVRIHNDAVPRSVPVVTKYEVLKSRGDLSLVEVELVTGRTHQIRAHMAFIGHPVLGDDKYGKFLMNRKYKVRRQVLFAKRIMLNLDKDCYLGYLAGKGFEIKAPFEWELPHLPIYEID